MKKEIILNVIELDRYLNKINTIFPVRHLTHQNISADEITNYYRDSSAGYKYFHSNEGAVHMALNYDGVFHKNGYYTQVN